MTVAAATRITMTATPQAIAVLRFRLLPCGSVRGFIDHARARGDRWARCRPRRGQACTSAPIVGKWVHVPIEQDSSEESQFQI